MTKREEGKKGGGKMEMKNSKEGSGKVKEESFGGCGEAFWSRVGLWRTCWQSQDQSNKKL